MSAPRAPPRRPVRSVLGAVRSVLGAVRSVLGAVRSVRGAAPYSRWGAHLTDSGARFAVASSAAEAVELCLVEPDPGGGSPHRAADRARRANLRRLARRGGGRALRAALRVPGARQVRPGGRAATQPGEAAGGPLRAAHRGPPRRPGRRPRLRSVTRSPDPRAAVTRWGRCRLSVLTEPPASEQISDALEVPWADTVVYEAHVSRVHHAPPGGAAAPAWHLSRAGPPGGHRAPVQARG